jgi:DNA-binding beta-propeller fold protein YncE
MHRALLLAILLLALLPRVGSAVPVETRAYVTATDWTTGTLGAVTLASRAVSADVASIHSDATLRWWGGKLYVVNRYGQDNIQVIDPAQGYATLRQFSTGNGSNPQDIAVVSATKAYVTCLALSQVLIVNPSAGTVTGSIPLTAFADGDGPPDAARMAIADGCLFVALQRLVNFAPAETSMVALIDLATDALIDNDLARPGIQGIPLTGRNPVTTFELDPYGRRLLIGCAGAYGVNDGGVEAIPLPASGVVTAGSRLASSGFIITEQALGGDVSDIAFLSPTHAYAIVSDASYNASVVSWSPASGQKLATVFAPGGFSLADMTASVARDELWVSDNDPYSPGLRVFRCSTEALIAGPLPTGLPPNQITFDRDDVSFAPMLTDVAPVTIPASGLALSAPWPNPARDRVALNLTMAHPGPVVAEVLDPAGRRVATLVAGGPPSRETTLEWDLRDELGNQVRPGVYVMTIRQGDRTAVRKIVAVR